VTDARASLSRLIAALYKDGERARPVFIGRHGEPMAVLLSLERFQEYRALVAARRQQLAPTQQRPRPRI
jgi:antitoxin (DNA-binding transcriptional repressor) of toxin-antitoxin stability system